MTLRSSLARTVHAVTDRVDLKHLPRVRARRDSEQVVEWLLKWEDPRGIRYPAFFANFMREWHERTRWRVTRLKGTGSGGSTKGLRLETLLEELGSEAPVPPASVAREAARITDGYLDQRDEVRLERWAGDVGLHFSISSSTAKKGRLLSAAMRFVRPESVLEIGTCLGMSAFFMARSLQALPGKRTVTTVECLERQHALAAAMLGERFGASVDCRRGSSADCLADLKRSSATFDFLFHDADHSYEAYVGDFEAAEPLLAPDAICVIDDIRWEDPRFHKGGARTYEGWRRIVDHPRVVAAAELDDVVGVVLLK